MSTEPHPGRSPDLTPMVEIEAWETYVRDDLQAKGMETLADQPVLDHTTGELTTLSRALAACESARIALDTTVEMGAMGGVEPLDAGNFFVRKQQKEIEPAAIEAFLKSAQATPVAQAA